MRPAQINRILYIIGSVVLLIGFGVLLWLRQQIAEDMQRAVAYSKSLFPKETVLKSPDDINISFSQIERLAAISKGSYYIDTLLITKAVADRGEITVYPFYSGALSPEWKARLQNFRKEELTDGDTLYGCIYLKLNKASLTGATIASFSFGILLALSIFGLLTRLRTQEMVLTKTTVELEHRKKELIRLERLALAGELMANVLHDIKKPVLKIRNEVPDLKQSLKDFAEASHGLNDIEENAEFFFSILNNLNMERFVTTPDAEKEYVNINTAIEQSLRLINYERGAVEIVAEFAETLPNILAHRYRLIQVFSNIILNAYQAMAEQGQLRISSKNLEDAVQVSIRDTGPGINEQNIPHLFEPFFTKDKEDGTGLGLYISSTIIEDLRGTIQVESVTGEGTTFIVIIPHRQEEKA